MKHLVKKQNRKPGQDRVKKRTENLAELAISDLYELHFKLTKDIEYHRFTIATNEKGIAAITQEIYRRQGGNNDNTKKN